MKSVLTNAWLRPEPDAPPDRQLLVGDAFDVESTIDGWSFGRAQKDEYQGYLPDHALGEDITPTHWVQTRSTWGYARPDIKSDPVIDLHMTARLEVLETGSDWLEARYSTGTIHVPAAHCLPIGSNVDVVVAARAFLGTPYLWAGNTGFGLDCSGLVQVAYHAAGRTCAADSQDQEVMAGTALGEDTTLQPGDLIFWKGHVAMATGSDTLIHANAHHMAVVEESTETAIARIASSDTGPVTSRLRPLSSSL